MDRRSLVSLALAGAATLILAACTPLHVDLVVEIAGTGGGTVRVNLVSIDETTTFGFPEDVVVDLVAESASGSVFAGWGGACGEADGTSCSVFMDSDKSVTATFDATLEMASATD